MTLDDHLNQPLDPRFSFWLPSADQMALSGVDGKDLPVPMIPLPLMKEVEAGPKLSKEDLGAGLYAYLRQFPDCPHNQAYAELLQQGFPHYISDLAAQALLLEHKTVDAPYLRRQLNCLKILALLSPERSDLQYQLGVASYRLALMFQELENCRRFLLSALGHLNRSLREKDGDVAALNYLAHVNYLIGDYPVATCCWKMALQGLEPSDAAESLKERIRKLEEWDVPDYPLVDDLEQLALGLEAYNQSRYEAALDLLDGIVERRFLLEEFSFPEFYYLAGLCQVQLQQITAAKDNFQRALKLDPDFLPAGKALANL